MARGEFRFRLERVRELRERAEDEATEHLAAAMAERVREAEKLAAAASRVEAARAAQLGAAVAGAVNVAAMRAHQAFIERSEREQRAAEMDLSRQEAEVEARRVALAEAARERQVLEQLKQRQADAHRRELERLEAARVDELALAMHRRRRAAA